MTRCVVPPPGWACSLPAGHHGSCLVRDSAARRPDGLTRLTREERYAVLDQTTKEDTDAA